LQGLLFTFDDTISQNFSNLLPRLRYSYRFGTGKRLDLRYNADFDEPSLRQLQPVVDNRNPFNIYQGNPELVPEFSHNFNGSFFYYDQFSFTSFFTFFNLDYIQNQIVESVTIDSAFRQFRTPVNVDEAWRGRMSLNFNSPIRPLKIKFGIKNNLTYNRGINFVNTQENLVTRINNSSTLTLENRKKKVWDAGVGGIFGYNLAQYSEATDLNRSFFNQRYFSWFRLNFLENWKFKAEFNYDLYAGGNFGERIAIPLLEASLFRTFFKDKITVELQAFDLLNQNKGVDRRAELNYVENTRNLTLTRYFMFKVSYAIGKGKKQGGTKFMIDKR